MDQWQSPESSSPSGVAGFTSLMTLSKVVIVLVILRVLAQSAMSVGSAVLIIAYPGTLDSPDGADGGAMAILMVTGLMALVLFGVVLIGLPIWIYWHYQAGRNLQTLGRDDLRHDPIGHAGWWFVPFANLIMPYRCMEELYLRSQPGDEMNPPPTLMWTWWVCWIGSNIASNISGRMGDAGIYLDLPALAVGIYATYLYLRWVHEISELQEQANILESSG